MARSTRGLYKRGEVWWMTYRDAIGTQRFESCKTSNKKEAEQRLIDRRKEALEGIVPAPAIKPLALDDLKERYLSYVGHQRGVATKHYHFAHFKRVWGNPPIHSLTVEVLDQYRALRLTEKVGPATINREMATLKHALSKAVEWKLLRNAYSDPSRPLIPTQVGHPFRRNAAADSDRKSATVPSLLGIGGRHPSESGAG